MPAEYGSAVLDPGVAKNQGWRQSQANLPGRHRLWRTGRWRLGAAQRHVELRCRIALHRKIISGPVRRSAGRGLTRSDRSSPGENAVGAYVERLTLVLGSATGAILAILGNDIVGAHHLPV